jgi:hypothetical protein
MNRHLNKTTVTLDGLRKARVARHAPCKPHDQHNCRARAYCCPPKGRNRLTMCSRLLIRAPLDIGHHAPLELLRARFGTWLTWLADAADVVAEGGDLQCMRRIWSSAACMTLQRAVQDAAGVSSDFGDGLHQERVFFFWHTLCNLPVRLMADRDSRWLATASKARMQRQATSKRLAVDPCFWGPH